MITVEQGHMIAVKTAESQFVLTVMKTANKIFD